jgi:hypothetical protein
MAHDLMPPKTLQTSCDDTASWPANFVLFLSITMVLDPFRITGCVFLQGDRADVGGAQSRLLRLEGGAVICNLRSRHVDPLL